MKPNSLREPFGPGTAEPAPPRPRDISTKQMDDALRSCMGEKRSFVLIIPERDERGRLAGNAQIVLGKVSAVEAVDILLGCAAHQHHVLIGAYEEELGKASDARDVRAAALEAALRAESKCAVCSGTLKVHRPCDYPGCGDPPTADHACTMAEDDCDACDGTGLGPKARAALGGGRHA